MALIPGLEKNRKAAPRSPGTALWLSWEFFVLKCIGCVSTFPSQQGALCPSSLASFPSQDPDDWQAAVNDKPRKQELGEGRGAEGNSTRKTDRLSNKALGFGILGVASSHRYRVYLHSVQGRAHRLIPEKAETRQRLASGV